MRHAPQKERRLQSAEFLNNTTHCRLKSAFLYSL
jgi:hypothetical protein